MNNNIKAFWILSYSTFRKYPMSIINPGRTWRKSVLFASPLNACYLWETVGVYQRLCECLTHTTGQRRPAKQTPSHTQRTIVCLKHINMLKRTHVNIYRIHSFYMRLSNSLLLYVSSSPSGCFFPLSVIIFFITTGFLINSSLCKCVYV